MAWYWILAIVWFGSGLLTNIVMRAYVRKLGQAWREKDTRTGVAVGLGGGPVCLLVMLAALAYEYGAGG